MAVITIIEHVVKTPVKSVIVVMYTVMVHRFKTWLFEVYRNLFLMCVVCVLICVVCPSRQG